MHRSIRSFAVAAFVLNIRTLGNSRRGRKKRGDSVTRLTQTGVVALVTALAALSIAPTHVQADEGITTRAEWIERIHGHADVGSGDRAPLNKNFTQVGMLDLGPFEISDVWAHGDYAYLSGIAGTPVQIVDISDPSSPSVAAIAASPDSECSSQDVKVETLNTRYFKGDLMAVGNEGCTTGLQLWDVSDPTDPQLLSAVSQIGEPEFIHNVYIFEQGNRAYVAAVSSFAEVFTTFFYGFTIGDFVIVDVTDPTNPVTVGDWGAGKDGGIAFGTPFFPPFFPPGSDCTPPPGGEELCRGDDFPGVFAHDVWVNEQGTLAYVSYWDAGAVILDISDPANPSAVGTAFEPETLGSDEGNAHVAVPAGGGNLLLIGDEDFTAGPWGFLRVFDTQDPASSVQVGAYATENTLTNPNPAISYSVHNVVVRGSRAYLSWYDDGIRVVDFSNPSEPREIAAFVPEGPSSFWGVYPHRNLVLGSDWLGGDLYILKMR